MGDPRRNNLDLDNSSMEKPCEICGDIGFVEALRMCSLCKNTREHGYCMKADDPDGWVCEECKSTSQRLPSTPVSSKMTNSTLRKPPKNTKVQYISPDEARRLESGAPKTKSPSPRKPTSISRFSPIKKHREEVIRRASEVQYARMKPIPQYGPPGFDKPLSPKSKLGSSHDRRPSTHKKNESPSLQKHQLVRKESPTEDEINGSSSRHIDKKANASMENETRRGSPLVQKKYVTEEKPSKAAVSESSSGSKRTSNIASASESRSTPHQPRRESLTPKTCRPSDTSTSFSLKRANVNIDSNSPQAVSHSTAAIAGKRNEDRIHREISTDKTPLHTGESSKSGRGLGRENFGRNSPQTVKRLRELNSDFDASREARLRKIDSWNKESERLAFKVDKHLRNRPAECPTWNGNFEFSDTVIPCPSINGIKAYPASKVSRVVFERSKQFPGALKFHALPRLQIWEALFENDDPGCEDIGLYFVLSQRSDQGYAYLVDYMDHHDMLLKCLIDGIELLVLSSKHLEEDSRRMRKKHFLWGLLRPAEAEKTPVSEPLNVSLPLGESDGEDMDIDMVGGVELPSIDRVVSRPKRSQEDLTGGEGLPSATTIMDAEVKFEIDLQRHFDKFTEAYCKKELPGHLKVEVKVEKES